jgi:hypothetical protein
VKYDANKAQCSPNSNTKCALHTYLDLATNEDWISLGAVLLCGVDCVEQLRAILFRAALEHNVIVLSLLPFVWDDSKQEPTDSLTNHKKRCKLITSDF